VPSKDKVRKNEVNKEYYHRNKERLTAEKREKWKDEKYKADVNARQRKYYATHAEEVKRKQRQRNLDIKVDVIYRYGGKCECCGEDELVFLTIDHINGGGSKHLKELRKSGTNFYKWLIDNNYPDGFRVLRMNCNLAYGIRGHCYHYLKK